MIVRQCDTGIKPGCGTDNLQGFSVLGISNCKNGVFYFFAQLRWGAHTTPTAGLLSAREAGRGKGDYEAE